MFSLTKFRYWNFSPAISNILGRIVVCFIRNLERALWKKKFQMFCLNRTPILIDPSLVPSQQSLISKWEKLFSKLAISNQTHFKVLAISIKTARCHDGLFISRFTNLTKWQHLDHGGGGGGEIRVHRTSESEV